MAESHILNQMLDGSGMARSPVSPLSDDVSLRISIKIIGRANSKWSPGRRAASRRRQVPPLRSACHIDVARALPAGLATPDDGNIAAAIITNREASMPNYDYGCEHCGQFTASRPMAEFSLPQPCPNCGDPAPRALTSPAISGGARETSSAALAPAHPGGCRCCATPGRFCAEAV